MSFRIHDAVRLFLADLASLPIELGRIDVENLLAASRGEEQILRHIYAQDRDNPILTDLYLGLLDVFSVTTLALRSRPRPQNADSDSFTRWTFPRGRTVAFPPNHLFPLYSHLRRERGCRAVVADLPTFQSNWDVFTHGALSRLSLSDWSNVVAGGGSVLACLSAPSSNLSNLELNELFQSKAYQDSDIDLFLYGLSASQAKTKMHIIYETIRCTLPWEMICVRRAHTITIYTQFPFRPLQIVMRLYKSPAEIAAGFDVDAACCLYNGKGVYVNPRALAAIVCQSNTIDLTRRSPSYEVHLAKYANRGFEVFYEGLDRQRINYRTLYHFTLSAYPKGLAHLLVLELTHTEPSYYHNFRQEPRSERTTKPPIDFKIVEKHLHRPSNYEFIRIPYRSGIGASQIRRMVKVFDHKANSIYNPVNFNRRLHRHAVTCPAPRNDEERNMVEKEVMYIRGPVRFIELNPGRQLMSGSFNPIDNEDWTEAAYTQGDE